METRELVAGGGERLDVFLVTRTEGISRSRAQRLVADGLVTVNGSPARAGLRLRAGDRVLVRLPPPPPTELVPEPLPLTVLYEDEELLVVDKPAGLAVHPAPGHPRGTLAHALLAHRPQLARVGEALRPGIVHRLDRDTSGVMVVAKTEEARVELMRQLAERSVRKTYLALVRGVPQSPEGVIEAPIGRDPRHRQRMAVVEGGKEARTRYQVRERFAGAALLEVHPETGRTHQVRVHLAAIGHPVVGDPVYGRRSELVPRQFLHAARLRLRLPSTGEEREFEAPLPPELEAALARLRGGAAPPPPDGAAVRPL